jgi:hypothetical protein
MPLSRTIRAISLLRKSFVAASVHRGLLLSASDAGFVLYVGTLELRRHLSMRLVESETLPTAPSPADLFKSVENKLKERYYLPQLQGVWIHSDIQEIRVCERKRLAILSAEGPAGIYGCRCGSSVFSDVPKIPRARRGTLLLGAFRAEVLSEPTSVDVGGVQALLRKQQAH